MSGYDFTVPDPRIIERFGRLRVVKGRNAWRLCLMSRYADRYRVMRIAARATAAMLRPVQPTFHVFYPWGRAPGAFAIGSGNARPIVPVEAKFGPPSAAPGLPAGELLGIRSTFLPAPAGADPIPVSLGMPIGGYPCWWVLVDFWWRAETVDLPAWPLLTRDGEAHAILDVAFSPIAQNPTPDKTVTDIVSEVGSSFVETSLADWDKAVASVNRPSVLIGTGGVLALLAVAYLSRRKG